MIKNKYEIRGDVTAIIINSPKYGRHEALISTSKLQRVMEFPGSWALNWKGTSQTSYVRGHMPTMNGKRKEAKLHRWITNAPSDKVVDHINHDVLCNTDENLRVLTVAENQQNRKGARVDNKSGVLGVHKEKTCSRWRAEIQINKKKKYLGLYDDMETAKRVVEEARRTYMPYSKKA